MNSGARLPTLALGGALIALLGGCAVVGRDAQPPDTAFIDDALDEPTRAADAGAAQGEALTAWWQVYRDPTLDALVALTVTQNRDLRAAWELVRAQRALVVGAEAAGRPQVDALGDATRRGRGTALPTDGYDRVGNRYQAALVAGWELDLWGMVQRQVEQAVAGVDAASAEAQGLRQGLIAETVRSYLALRHAEADTMLARTDLAAARRLLRLHDSLRQGGIASDAASDAAAQEVELAVQALAAMQARHETALRRLAVACGRPPALLPLAPGALPLPGSGLPALVPAELLRQRPDLRALEQRTAARIAAAGVAEGDLYPRVRLIGDLGLTAQVPSDLAQRDASFWSFGLSVQWALFRGGAVRAGIAAADARSAAALASYEQAVLRAVGEVGTATADWQAAGQRLESSTSELRHAERALAHAQQRQRAGIAAEEEVLAATRTRITVERRGLGLRRERGDAYVAVLTALGCGWQPDPAGEPASAQPLRANAP